ncbi:MAG: HpcH/HpaI aldolase/citrate lyase family protein [Pseudomonadota bacterium]|jgi:malyl-CoA/(S)-citramalyl-CoA lyase
MSLTVHPSRSNRLFRSELAVPGSQPRLFEKAARSEADAVYLDLEDAVALDEKAAARANVVDALNGIDWGARTVEVRVNGLDTPHAFRDIIEVVGRCPRLDLLIVPKVSVPADLYAVDVLVSQVEMEAGRQRPVGLVALVETALGMASIEQIAQSGSRRLEGCTFGSGDFAASTRMRTTGIGGVSGEYGVLSDPASDGTRGFHWGDPWHAIHSRLVIACRAWGLRPVDGPFADFRDGPGLAAAARRAAALGFEGKMCIHPAQIPVVNEVFSPSEGEVAQARRILDAMEQARRDGRGAVALDGRMLDIVSIRQAEQLLERASAIAARAGASPAA